MGTSVKVTKTFEEIVNELATSKNAARTAIKALNSFIGNTAGEPIQGKDIGKLTLAKLAGMTGVGDKTFMLICGAFYLWNKQ